MSIDWSELYRTTFPDLVRFLHRKVWDPDRARDLAQEAFVRALQSPPDQPRAWLFRVAGNLARDEARTVVRRKRHLALLKGEAQVRQEGAPGPAEALEAADRGERVRTALEALTERDREALLLKEAGLSYAEIARETGLAVGAVGTTLARARKRLAEAYQEERNDAARG
ncbi:MAG TPA: sigma-70 family RNA polymerase sigma factor [Longimicrobiales bacterium]|nr:sigma-70 family RNA polymerase sigma factor [Longimicrobiales bacterium]